jgi:hypothetical protein
MLTIDQLQNDGSLYEYFYSDGVAWGVGEASEARDAVEYCGESADMLRFKKIA